VDLDVATSRWPSVVETTAYFVICEALTNALKHGHASRAVVRVRGGPEKMRLVVADDGCGGAELHDNGGLTGLRDRVSALGGTFRVVSPPSKGTRLSATIPAASPVTSRLMVATRAQLQAPGQTDTPLGPPLT